MADVSVSRNADGDVELSLEHWYAICGCERVASDEKVVALGKLGADGTLTLPKAHWTRSLKGLFGLTSGDGNELVPDGDSGRDVLLSDQVIAGLGVGPKDPLCICEADGRYSVKSITCRELVTEMPGWIVLDEFHPSQVVRWWSSHPEMTAISTELLDRVREAAGALRVDPIPAVERMTDEALLPAKKELLGSVSHEDERKLSAYVARLRQAQLADGSWNDSAVTTAGTLIRLLQSGVADDDPALRRGVSWLEHSDEPLGMPGLFLYDEEAGREYNRRKAAGEALLDVSPAKQRSFFDTLSRDFFGPFLDLVPKSKACEPHTTWATALSLQALLRSGRADSPRVARAIDTLMRWRSHMPDSGGWCGCGIFGSTLADRDIDPGEPVDFDSAKLPESNKDLEFATWFMNKPAVRSMVCNPYAENYTCLSLGGSIGILVKNRMSSPSSNCTTVLQSALARHPDYHGTRLEHLAAYEMSGMQNPNGDWPSHRASGMLHFLSLIDHPLARFLAYRGLPSLVRQQREDGLWFSGGNGGCADDLVLLTALKRLGVLEELTPARARR